MALAAVCLCPQAIGGLDVGPQSALAAPRDAVVPVGAPAADLYQPWVRFTSPTAGVSSAPNTATLAVPGPAGSFLVPYIQTSADLAYGVDFSGPAERSIIVVTLDRASASAQSQILRGPRWNGVFKGLAYGEHTLDALLYVLQAGDLEWVVMAQPPAAVAHLDRVARGEVVAALGDSTTEGFGEDPLPLFPDWTAAARAVPWAVSRDGRNYPQPGGGVDPGTRPSFSVPLGSALEGVVHRPVLVLNEGWSGSTADMYSRIVGSSYLATIVSATHPSMWVINLGPNDALLRRSPGDYAASVESIVNTLETRYQAIPDTIHLACPSYAAQDFRRDLERQYLPVIDHIRSTRRLGAGPNLFAFFRDHPDGLSDAVHPNPAGYRATAVLWAEALTRPAKNCA